MNINIDDPKLSNYEEFKTFLKENPGRGYVKVRASAASEALPISGVEVIVTKKIGDYIVEFFRGQTDESGMINGIVLPTPSKTSSNEDVPNFADYELQAIYKKENFDKVYNLLLCCSVSVIQYINIVPSVIEGNK